MARLPRIVTSVTVIALLTTLAAIAPSSAAPSKVRLVPVLSGYDRPVLVTNHGGASRTIFIVEQGGKIKRATFKNGSYQKAGTFLDISAKVNDPTQNGRGEQGLLGLAFHPKYKNNGRFYVFYTREGVPPESGDVVIAEYRRQSATKADATSERVLMVIEKVESNHQGGHLAFGPDGRLYIALGDAGGHEDPDDNGQDLGTLWGSLLRIDPVGADRGDYKIPGANPYTDKAGRDEIWSNGLRNPWRFSFDRRNGNLWIGDVGEKAREEVNKATSNRFGRGAGMGKNYGWSDCEGSLEFKLGEGDADDKCETHVLPIYDYAIDRDKSRCSVIGGHVYRGPADRKWQGLYVAGDFCGRVFVLNQSGKVKWSRDGSTMLASFGEDAAGRLFATGIFNGDIYRVRLTGPRP